MTARHRPLLSSLPRRSGWLRPAASVALFAMLALFGSPAARAVDDSELDAAINEILSNLPPDQAATALREILAPDSGDLVTESYAVSPGSLQIRDSTNERDYFDLPQGVFSLFPDSCVYAPLHLPQGATVAGLLFWFFDDAAGSQMAADIRRKSLTSTAGAEVMGSVVSTDGAGIRLALDATISNGVIDNDNYVYSAFVCLQGILGPELHGLYIIYNR